jgi:hypothetical protein
MPLPRSGNRVQPDEEAGRNELQVIHTSSRYLLHDFVNGGCLVFPYSARWAETRASEFLHFISIPQGDQPYIDDSGNGLQQIVWLISLGRMVPDGMGEGK